MSSLSGGLDFARPCVVQAKRKRYREQKDGEQCDQAPLRCEKRKKAGGTEEGYRERATRWTCHGHSSDDGAYACTSFRTAEL